MLSSSSCSDNNLVCLATESDSLVAFSVLSITFLLLEEPERGPCKISRGGSSELSLSGCMYEDKSASSVLSSLSFKTTSSRETFVFPPSRKCSLFFERFCSFRFSDSCSLFTTSSVAITFSTLLSGGASVAPTFMGSFEHTSLPLSKLVSKRPKGKAAALTT